MPHMPAPETAGVEIRDWINRFEAAVRARDFTAGRSLFAPDAVAFGTFAAAVAGLDNIEREQWRQIWPRIRDFSLDRGATVRTAGDAAWIATGWSSEATAPDSRPFRRPGRATFVLERRDGRWLAVHSHVSLLPSQSDEVHGRPA
jgi:uncharacterized protein (TIGR02246 family)